MAKIVVRLEIEVDAEWAARGAEFVAEQAEKVIDNNCGGHATAYLLEIERNDLPDNN